MAFVFVPNAGGGFDEGMRQTNPETGVEYIYIEGAWRPLGPKIEDQYDVLDERYVNQDGDTMHGEFKFDQGENTPANLLIYPNILNTSSSLYALNSGTLRIRSLPGENRAQGSSTHIAVGKNEIDGEPETFIYHLQDPQSEEHGANKRYVDEQVGNINVTGDYVPLAGGDMTGDLNMMNARIDTFNAAGEQTMEISPGGFIKTRDMLRVVRTDGGPAFEAREGDASTDTRAEINSTGTWRFDGVGDLKADVRLKDRGRYIVRGTANSDVGYFMATSDSQCQLGAYTGKTLNIKNLNAPTDNTDAATKIYVDNSLLPYQTAADVQAAINSDTVHLSFTGTQLVTPGNWRIQQANSTGGTYSYISIDSDELKLYHVKEPTAGHHAATKGYVDANPGNGITAARPPGLKFDLSIVNLPNGYFQWWTNNSTNNQHLELATTDKDGIAWGTNTLREDVRYSDNIPFTIWEVSNNAWKMKVTGTISRIDFHPDHALCYVSSKTALNGGNFVNGSGPYYITISGLF